METGESFPVYPPEAQALVSIAIEALNAIGFDFGPSHTEIVMTANGPRIIEINPRLGGGLISLLIKDALGIDPVIETLRMYQGLAPRLESTKSRGCASRYFCSPCRGTLIALKGVEYLRNHRQVRSIEIGCQPGQNVERLRSNLDFLGNFYVVSETPELARNVVDELCKQLTVQVSAQVVF